ncbi:MAG: hypothetical protein ACREJO_12625 [Phycisphaerales bacterium]
MSVNERDNPMHEPQGPGESPMDACERYLWDGTGTSDVETARLEGTLRPLRHGGELPASIGADVAGKSHRMKFVLAAATAVLLLAVAGLGLWLTRPRGPEQIGPWTVAEKSGTVMVGEQQASKDRHLGTSCEVKVESGASVVLCTADGGRVVLRPGVTARVSMDVGTVAVPWVGVSRGMVTVECGSTPIGVDVFGYGTVFEKGSVGQVMLAGSSAEVTVKSGSVAFEPTTEMPTRLIEGMVCRVDQAGPRVPLRADAPREFSKSVRDVQMVAAKDPKAAPKAADEVAASARREDLATLWNLAWRLEPESRRPIIERIAMETGLMKQKFALGAAVKGDPGAMDQLWEAVRGAAAEKAPEKPPEKTPMKK